MQCDQAAVKPSDWRPSPDQPDRTQFFDNAANHRLRQYRQAFLTVLAGGGEVRRMTPEDDQAIALGLPSAGLLGISPIQSSILSV